MGTPALAMKPAASVLLTGAGRGIGRNVALHLARHTTMSLTLVSRTANVERTAAECNAIRPHSARPIRWDLVSNEEVQLTIGHATLADFERERAPLALVHAAAVLGPTGPFVTTNLDDWWDALELNLGASVVLVQRVLPRMLQHCCGRIILFAGGGAAYGYPRFSSYGVAKAALVRFVETLALELGNDGPVVNIIAPGANETDLLAQVRAAGGEVRTTVDPSEPCVLVERLLTEDTRGLQGRFLHVRDEWTAEEAHAFDADWWKLRRIERKR